MKIKYSKIISPHIKDVIAKTQWNEKHKVDSLIQLDHFIRNGVKNWIGSLLFHNLKIAYPNDFLILLKEYSTEEFNQHLTSIDKKKSLVTDSDIEKTKKDWIKAGGKI